MSAEEPEGQHRGLGTEQYEFRTLTLALTASTPA